MEIKEIIAAQKSFFESGRMRNVERRIMMLKRLLASLKENEQNISDALLKDLGRSTFETYTTEIMMLYDDINYTIRHLRIWAAPRIVMPSLLSFPSGAKVYKEAKGVVLVISPWNFPLLLSIQPLIAALAAGNCVVVKPSEFAPATADAIEKIVESCFPPELVTVVKGGADTAIDLLNQKFDHIFYTGNGTIARSVMRQASENLVPVTLELGGKSPCIVDKTANLDMAARRIAWGKSLNAGQICVAPDYVLVDNSIKVKFMNSLAGYFMAFFGDFPLECKDLASIVNENHFNRILGLMEDQDVYYGGKSDINKLKIEPTIIKDPSADSKIMNEEIFGPLLPVIGYNDLHDALEYINSKERPLALYVFSESRRRVKKIIKTVPYGGGCVNDTIMHLTNQRLPFGGTGESGMGSYHGRKGFDTFTHEKSIVFKSTKMDMSVRYAPYGDKLEVIKKIKE